MGHRPAQVPVEAEILLAKEFCDVQYLPCMHREVLDYVIDTLEDALVIPLHSDLLGQPVRAYTFDHGDCFVERSVEFRA